MTKQEQQQLSDIIDRLIEVQATSPETIQIIKGRSTASVKYQLLEIIRDFKEVIGYESTTTESEEPEATA